MCGCGSGAILEALPTPLGSTVALFIPPALPGPRGIPLMGTFPIAPEPAGRANPPIAPPCPPLANAAVGEAKTTKNTKATFTDVFDMGKLHYLLIERPSRGADVGWQSIDIYPVHADLLDQNNER
jgi:hypothetical protein